MGLQIQNDKQVVAKQSDVVVSSKLQKKAVVIDADSMINKMEHKKLKNYQELRNKREVRNSLNASERG